MFQCPICYAPFNSIEACHDHMEIVHGISQEAPEETPEEVVPKGKKAVK